MFQTLIASATVGAGGATTITFSGIPGTFTDLALLVFARNTSAGNDFGMLQLNSTTTGYTNRYLQGNGGATTSQASMGGATNGLHIGLVSGTNTTASTFSSHLTVIPNYSNGLAKTCSSDSVTENNGATALQIFSTGSSSVTAAITTIEIKMAFGTTYAENTTAYLYGTLKGSGGATAA